MKEDNSSSNAKAVLEPTLKTMVCSAPGFPQNTGWSVTEHFNTLIQRVSSQKSDDDRTQKILLDTTLAGVRYLLVRLPKSETSAPALSPREEEIVRMVSQGLPNKIIAGVLDISTWTVSTYLRRIFAKLGVTSRAAMVAQVFEVHAVRERGTNQFSRVNAKIKSAS